MVISIDEILKVPFSSRTKEEQIRIVQEGKPRPELPNHLFGSNKKFDITCYDKDQWLTACDRRHTFYCWSCLLFVSEPRSIWTTEGYDNYKHLNLGISEHSSTADHISGQINFQWFAGQIATRTDPLNIPKNRGVVKKDDDLFRRILHFLCYVVSQTPYPPKNVNSFQEYIINKCTEALNLFKTYEMNNASEKTVDLMSSPKVLTNYVGTLSAMVKVVIRKEMLNCTHVSLILNEHPNCCGTAVSVVFRYLKDGKVCERFVGFCYLRKTNVKHGEFFPEIVGNVVSEYGVQEKLLAFSFEGTLESLVQLQRLISYMRQTFGCLFVPCYFHSFEAVIERSVSQADRNCDHFFKGLSCMRNYLKSTSKMRNAFNSFIQDNNVINLNFYQSNFRFVRVLKLHKRQFENFFQFIVSDHEEWTGDDVIKAKEFLRTLEDVCTIFLLETFFMLSDNVVAVSDILSSCSPENMFERIYYESCQSYLCNMKKDEFPRLRNIANTESKDLQPNLVCINTQNVLFHKLETTFNKTIDCVIGEVKLRIEPLQELTFFQLLNPEKRGKLVLSDYTQNLMNDFFDETQIQSELNEIQKENSLLGGNKSVHKVMEILLTHKLQDQFKNIYKLAEVILSMPCKPASLDENVSSVAPETQEISDDVNQLTTDQGTLSSKSFLLRKNLSKLDTIKAWSDHKPLANIASYWSLLCIEHDILKSLQSQEQFYDDFMSMQRLTPFNL